MVEYLMKAIDYFSHAMMQEEQLNPIASPDIEMDTKEEGRVGPMESMEMDLTGIRDAEGIDFIEFSSKSLSRRMNWLIQ